MKSSPSARPVVTSAPVPPNVRANAAAGDPAAAAAAYLKMVAQQANTLFGAALNTTLVPLAFPAQGDFNWSYTNGNNLNGATWSYISGSVTQSATDPALYQLGAAGSFPEAYQQLLQEIVFQFSAADNTRLQNSITKSSTQATSVVSTFNAAFGAPVAADYATANTVLTPFPSFGPNTEIDYIIGYVMGYIWAGKPANALTLAQMQSAPSLNALLPAMPPSGANVLNAVTTYLEALGVGAQLRDQQSLANWTLAQLKLNTANPGAGNGGIQVFNGTPSQPTGSFAVGYGISPSTTAILQQLQGTTSFSASFSAQSSSSSTFDVAFQGSAGFSVGSLLSFSSGTSVQGEIARQSGAGSAMSITVNYPGVTSTPAIAASPAAWNGASFQSASKGTTGWWYEAVLNQALANLKLGAKAPSGFAFGQDPTVPIGAVNTTGFASTLLVSAYPTITVNFSNGSFSAFSQWLATQTKMSLSLFGVIPLGSGSVDTYTASAKQGSSDSSFSLVLTAPAPGAGGGTIDPSQQTVPVLGVGVTWAGLSTT